MDNACRPIESLIYGSEQKGVALRAFIRRHGSANESLGSFFAILPSFPPVSHTFPLISLPSSVVLV
ncbi:hypothetical protein SLEP1_g35465 [Rubroshorea leprosula]|uniref:Uncharacterized protein n=1 Tax=Rubroshorea leprosula TaxID=152421 RepID=A0AAV5KN77_9ROSI|nr:hypothetical protein SLEP1_g35465 [Rubroshorea leprosula]